MNEKFRFIRCNDASDILVVESTSAAMDIAGRVPNACHNHMILVRAEYEKRIENAVSEERKLCAKMKSARLNEELAHPNTLIFGLSLKEIRDAISFATAHGWKISVDNQGGK